MRKRKKLMVFILGCMALLLIGSSLAIWSGKLQQVNELKADTMSAKIEETFVQGAEPTGTVTKQVSFKNDSSCSTFLRVSYAETWETTEGSEQKLLNNQINGIDVAKKNWLNGFGENSDLWQDGGDGWYYYKWVLQPDAQTETILESVTFPDYTGEYKAYQDADYQRSIAFSILQIGELSGGLSEEYRKATSSRVQWGPMKGMRNLVAHSYGSMNREIIWETAVNDIPTLKQFCEEQLAEN